MGAIKILEVYKELVIGELPYPGYSLDAVRKELVRIVDEHKHDELMRFVIDTREWSV